MRGQFVTVLDEVWEVPSFYWCTDETTLPREQPVRVRFLPAAGGVPMQVKRVCLPFVLVQEADKEQRSIDVRRCRLAQLGKAYAKVAWRAFRKANKLAEHRRRHLSK